jgi:hypothetical protein
VKPDIPLHHIEGHGSTGLIYGNERFQHAPYFVSLFSGYSACGIAAKVVKYAAKEPGFLMDA